MTLRALLLLKMTHEHGIWLRSPRQLESFDNPPSLCYDFRMLQTYGPQQALYSYPGGEYAPQT